MLNQKQILKVAFNIVASEYPYGMDDRTKPFYDKLKQGLENKCVFNVDYEDIKFRFNRCFEDLDDNMRKTNASLNLFLYLCADASLNFVSINKYIRNIRSIIKSKNKDKINECLSYGHLKEKATYILDHYDEILKEADEFIQGIESWLLVIDMLKEAKNYIVKGRKPIERQEGYVSPVYVPPMPSSSAIQLVEAKLKEIVDAQKGDLINKMKSYVYDAYDDYAGQTDYQEIIKFLKSKGMENYFSTTFDTAGSRSFTLRDDYKARILREVERQVQGIIESYTAKNVSKIAPVVHAKGEPQEVNIMRGNLQGWGFSGVIQFIFSDGTSFEVENQAVFKVNYCGTQYVQFPTIFHKVKFKNGTVKSMQSEKEMNEVWALEK